MNRRSGIVAALTMIGVWLPGRPSRGDEPRLVTLERSVTITRDVRIAPGTYRLPAPGDLGALRIAGDGITVDFQGAELVGSADDAPPDTYAGRGIVMVGRNLTLKNAKVRGFKIGIFATETPGVTIVGCDVSRNYRQHLGSTLEREDLGDWLYGQDNDEHQWLRYGAGIYLDRCPNATVSGNRARNGQNGLCVERCDDSVIVDNDFSFLSGWGIALWRTSRCDVSHNRTDWCMRGYSHGVYSRGQDSTGLLVYEQCSDNVFAFNSATHSGDGFFLYAGNETVQKTGTGGCNRNLLYRNDFSHAAANGIEATFSQGNLFIENILRECEHGIWAGYSHDTIIAGNEIADCKHGISIEHGRGNLIVENTIRDTGRGVHLWWDDDAELLASPFGRARENCPSTENRVLANVFERVETAVRLSDDTRSALRWNRLHEVRNAAHLTGNASGTVLRDNALADAGIRNEARDAPALGPNESAEGYTKPEAVAGLASRLPPPTKGTQDAYLPKGQPRGRQTIVIDEWGPYDFTDLRLFPQTVRGAEQAALAVLGPSGRFKVAELTGDVEVSPREGQLPGRIAVSSNSSGVCPFRLTVEAGGKALMAAGTLLRADWTVRFFAWDSATDPREHSVEWDTLLRGAPLEERRLPALDFVWGGAAPGPNVPPERFGTLATTRLQLPAGRWRVHTVSDDGIRVWIDGQRLIDDWTWHPPKDNDTVVELDAGAHEIRIEHFEIDGHAQLQFRLDPPP